MRFQVHDAIDAFSIGKGCPVSDLGTENGLAASIQSYFEENIDISVLLLTTVLLLTRLF